MEDQIWEDLRSEKNCFSLKNLRELWESNSGRLGEKHERFLCAMPSFIPFFAGHLQIASSLLKGKIGNATSYNGEVSK